ncbi:MAG: type II toxin-antitoxin system prevent-host-death family antitoxin [Candidatus Hydrogenedentes bacterium]|nr:type II toxin-antitoxin system prevent-host-death family antitoxin [Candidatus Hydrogenedentota bacterium]
MTLREAKRDFEQLVECAAAGEAIVITRAGEPAAKLVPYCDELRDREPGYWQGQVKIRDDLNELPDDIAAAFRGDD